MRNKIIYFTGLAILTAVYAAQPASAPATPSTLDFPTYGFRINSLEMPTTQDVSAALQMSWPQMPMPRNKNLTFAPNVNVVILNNDKGMADYIDNQRLSMRMSGISIVADDNADAAKPGSKPAKPDQWNLEYIAPVGTPPNVTAMHWYVHAVFSKSRVYVATGGMPDEMWTLYSDKIKDCVNSLETTEPIVAAPTPAMIPAPAVAPAASSASSKSTAH